MSELTGDLREAFIRAQQRKNAAIQGRGGTVAAPEDLPLVLIGTDVDADQVDQIAKGYAHMAMDYVNAHLQEPGADAQELVAAAIMGALVEGLTVGLLVGEVRHEREHQAQAQ